MRQRQRYQLHRSLKRIERSHGRLNSKKATEKLASRRFEWHFNSPGAPHFGSAWENLIKSAKRALSRVLGSRT